MFIIPYKTSNLNTFDAHLKLHSLTQRSNVMGGGVSWVNSGQSYKESTSVNYDSRVILTIILLKFTTLEM